MALKGGLQLATCKVSRLAAFICAPLMKLRSWKQSHKIERVPDSLQLHGLLAASSSCHSLSFISRCLYELGMPSTTQEALVIALKHRGIHTGKDIEVI